MATHQIGIFGGNTVPDSTGRVWLETYDTIATNDVWKPLVWRFANPGTTQSHGVYGTFSVPQNYVGTAAIVPVWTSTATSGNCRWRLTYRTVGGDDTTSLDQTSNEEQVSVTDAAPGAANRRLTPSLSPTSANFAAGETVEFLFERNDDSGTDTMAADAVVFDLIFQYADV
jgi:hypothetical protein